jgi:hypothetical protein
VLAPLRSHFMRKEQLPLIKITPPVNAATALR